MIEEKLNEIGFKIPEAPIPLASYIPAVQVGNLVFTAGQIPMKNGELIHKGKIGIPLTEGSSDEISSVETGIKAAELCTINCLSVIKSVIGDLDMIKRIIKVTVFVNSADSFTEQPKVANGASDLLVKVFGENGKHVRSAVGVNELPIDSAVEVEMIVEV
ncbi:MAG: RidA family protein [Melioribacteraceae bacterium]|nr:RidA family protein [Melioribacteraceae bacterium]